MPYIHRDRRRWLQRRPEVSWHDTDRLKPHSTGELNFVITNTLVRYVEEQGLNYRVINDVLGALEGAKLEFYRRLAVPYEDAKIEQNGDVYPAYLLDGHDESKVHG